jgi:hypothetical protein
MNSQDSRICPSDPSGQGGLNSSVRHPNGPLCSRAPYPNASRGFKRAEIHAVERDKGPTVRGSILHFLSVGLIV